MDSKTIIVATDNNWVIGIRPDKTSNGCLPWEGKQRFDMKFFKEQTSGKRVLFTRPTYMSIPERFRPLKDRVVGVLTSDPKFSEPGIIVFTDIQEAVKWTEVIAGGGQLYEKALEIPGVDTILRTRIDYESEGNVFFPVLHRPEWKIVSSKSYGADEQNEFPFHIERYEWGVKTKDDIEVVPYPHRIVDPRGARSRSYLLELLELQRVGKCPFCEGGKTLLKDPIIEKNDTCWIKHSHTPNKGVSVQYLVAPTRHRRNIHEITQRELVAMNKMLKRHVEAEGYALSGCMSFTRSGPTEATGATVCHVHQNVAFPKEGVSGYELLTVFCGHYEGEPGWLQR